MAARHSILTQHLSLFRRTRALATEIDTFLDKLSESGLLFKRALQVYLAEGCTAEFEEKLHSVNRLESDADKLRRSIDRTSMKSGSS